MRRTTDGAGAGLALALAAVGCASAPSSIASPSAAACDVAPGGPVLDASLPEADPGIEAVVQGIDVGGLPDPLDTSAVDPMSAALLAYALELPLADVQPALALSAVGGVGEALAAGVRASFAATGDGALDPALLRRVVARWYACDRGLPPTLDGFRAAYGGWDDAAVTEIAYSTAKAGPRTLFDLADRGVYVAQSPAAGGIGVDTEIVLAGYRDDGALEFLAYDADGIRRDAASLAFGGVLAPEPAPYACALCHRDLHANTFTVVRP